MQNAGRDLDRGRIGCGASGQVVRAALAVLLLGAGCGPGDGPPAGAPPATVVGPAVPTAGVPAAVDVGPGPAAGARSGWLNEVRGRIVASQYRVRPDARGVKAANHAHGLSARWQEDALDLLPAAAHVRAGALRVRSVAFGRGSATRAVTGGRFRVGGCRADGATDERGACLRRVERDAGGLTEWWENTPAGLEQGFVIAQPPRAPAAAADAWLRIEVQVAGARVQVAADGNQAVLSPPDGRRLRYAGLTAWDAAGRALPARMQQGTTGLWLEIDDAGARYPVVVDPVLTAVTWSAESDSAGAGTDMVVAGAGDVNDDGLDDVLVAFPGFDGATSDEGRVFLYFGGPDGPNDVADWTSQGTNAGGTQAATSGSRFGSSAVGAGDVNGDGFADVIIGQSGWSNGQAGEGRAYVFHGGAGGLGDTPDWVVESDLDGAALGAVSGAGDIDGNGFDDVVLGAPGGSGRVLVYLGSGTGLAASAADTITGVAGQRFGAAVASAGDVNGDGRDDVLVAAPAATNPETEEGAAYAYLGQADGKLGRTGAFGLGTRPSFETNEAGAGVSAVVGLGDINGDGYADVAVGSSRKNNGAAGSDAEEGVVFVFTGSGSGLAVSPVLVEGNQAGGAFGAAVAGPGDVNGDGYADIVVGASGWTADGKAGAGALVFIAGSAAGPATTNATLADTLLVGALAGDALGSAAAAAGDINSDDYADVIAGAAGVDGGQNNEGRAFVYSGSASTNGLRLRADKAVESNTAGAGLGLALAGAGDINGDGFGDIALAAPNAAGAGNGRVFIYLGGAGGPDDMVDGTLSGPAGAGFGKAVSRAGDVNGDGFDDLLVGAPNFSDGQTDEGRVYLFSGSSGGITESTVPVFFDSNVGGALLGAAVGSGDFNADGLSDVLAGAPALSNGENQEGRVYLLRGSPGGLLRDNPITVESNVAGARFGTAVAGAGDVDGNGFGDVVVGAPGYSGSFDGQGRLYIYPGTMAGLGMPYTRDGEPELNAALGTSVDGAGDVELDGYGDVVAGAPGANNGAGTVVLYEGSVAGPVEIPYSYASPVAGARLGTSVAGTGDLDRDAVGDVVVGAPGYARGEANEGAVYVFLSGGTPLPGAVSQIIEGEVAGLQLGTAVSGAGDVNGDGVTDVLIGAPGFSNPQSGEGRALLHLGNTNGRPYRLRALRPSSMTIVQGGAVVPASTGAFDIAILASGPLGITRVRLETEVKPFGVRFNDNDAVAEPGFTSSGLTGVILTRHVTGLDTRGAYHYRARLLFDSDQRTLRGRRTPWFYGLPQGDVHGVHLRTDGVASGTACTTAAQCGAGPCVDGVCCNSACGGGVDTDCEACSMARGGTGPDGTCSPKMVGVACNDVNACTGPDTCQANRVCAGPSAVTCPAPDACHDPGVCNPASGICSNPSKTDGTPCTDSNMCTATDLCMAGVCQPGAARSCDDSNPCTTDSCNTGSGCVNLPMSGCTPPPDAGPATDAQPTSDAQPTDDSGVTPSDGPAGDDGPGASDGPADRRDTAMADAARDTRDAARDAEITRGGGGGGCDCHVGGRRPPGGGQAGTLLIALGAVLALRRRRRPSR
jgi:MYXO-CTERM domain-containing protein